MLRLYLSGSALVLILLMILMVIMRIIGTFAPEHPMLASIERCGDLPCWLNINVDSATPNEARAIFEAHGYRTIDDVRYLATSDPSACEVQLSEGFMDIQRDIASIQVMNCQNLTIGDLSQVLGVPLLVTNDCFKNWVMWYPNSIAVYFSGELLPYTPVFQIAFINLGNLGINPYGVEWHGFMTQWRYNQLEENIRGC